MLNQSEYSAITTAEYDALARQVERARKLGWPLVTTLSGDTVWLETVAGRMRFCDGFAVGASNLTRNAPRILTLFLVAMAIAKPEGVSVKLTKLRKESVPPVGVTLTVSAILVSELMVELYGQPLTDSEKKTLQAFGLFFDCQITSESSGFF